MLRTALLGSFLISSACAENTGVAEGANECMKGVVCGLLTGGMNGLNIAAHFACGQAMDLAGVDFLHSVPGWRAEDRNKGIKVGGDIGDEADLALWKPYLDCTNKKQKQFPNLEFAELLAQCGFKQNDFKRWYQKFLVWTHQNAASLQGGAINAVCGMIAGHLTKQLEKNLEMSLGEAAIQLTGKMVAASEKGLARVWEKMGLEAMAAGARASAELMERQMSKVAFEALESAGARVAVRVAEGGIARAATSGIWGVLERIGFSLLDDVPQNQTALQEELEASKEANAQESIFANSTLNAFLAKALGFCAVGCVGLLTLRACSKIGRKPSEGPADVESLPPVYGEGFHFGQQEPVRAGGAHPQMPVRAGGAQLHGPAHGHLQPGPNSCAQGAYMPIHGPKGHR